MGLLVGDFVGDCMGDFVGDLVGDFVGDLVGDSVGDAAVSGKQNMSNKSRIINQERQTWRFSG